MHISMFNLFVINYFYMHKSFDIHNHEETRKLMIDFCLVAFLAMFTYGGATTSDCNP